MGILLYFNEPDDLYGGITDLYKYNIHSRSKISYGNSAISEIPAINDFLCYAH
jgi:hypothetical protein